MKFSFLIFSLLFAFSISTVQAAAPARTPTLGEDCSSGAFLQAGSTDEGGSIFNISSGSCTVYFSRVSSYPVVCVANPSMAVALGGFPVRDAATNDLIGWEFYRFFDSLLNLESLHYHCKVLR